jgi:hypothetical protein
MSHEFNLIGTAPRAARRRPATSHLAIAAGATLVLGLAAAIWLGSRANAAEGRIEAANLAIEDLMLNLQERSQFLAQRNADPELVAKLQLLERESTDKGRVLDLLAGKALGNTAGFSDQLAAFGRRNPDGLWLRRVSITDGGREIAIRGGALEAALVPRFIDALQEEPAFRGTSFQHFELENSPGGAVNFSLATACGGADEAAAEDCREPEAAPEAEAAPDAGPAP